MKLVIYPPVDQPRLARIAATAQGQVVNAQSEAEATRELADADAFFGKLTPSLLSPARQLRWVQSPTASLEHYMFPELVAHRCVLTNMRGLYSDVIADHVFAYILCFARNLHRYLRQQMSGHWEPIGGEHARATFTSGPGTVSAIDQAHLHVSDCTLGVVGLGNIGSEIARRGVSFGMHVIAVDPMLRHVPEGVDVLWTMDRLRDLLGASDFVVVAAPHTPETEGMFGTDQFQQMKSSAYFINIGRGVIVQLSALTSALESRQLAGAALDVFEVEPLPANHPLWQMDNVLITPHVAASSVHIAERHLAVLLGNIARFQQDEPLKNVVDKQKWY